MEGSAAMSEGLSLNTLLNKEREIYDIASSLQVNATRLLVEITGDESFVGKPGIPDERERKEPPVMGGIHELQKMTNIQLSILGDRLEQLHKVLFGK